MTTVTRSSRASKADDTAGAPITLSTSAAFKELTERMREIADLNAIGNLVDWDQQTQMAMGANAIRGEQLATLAGVMHERLTSPRLGKAIDKADAALTATPEKYSDADRAVVREARRRHEEATKLPDAFVRAYSVACSTAWESWQRAKAAKDFSIFADDLARVVDLTRQKAQYLNPSAKPYEVLFDQFEPGLPLASAVKALEAIRTFTVPLLKKVQKAKPISRDALLGEFPHEKQIAFSRTLLEILGYQFNNGRLDLAAHPFETTIGSPFDVRVTTRVDPTDVVSCLLSVMHECGHGLYELGIDPALSRTILAGGTSSAIHESQSRTWENIVGRSEYFWQAHYKKLQAVFPKPFKQVSVEDFVRAINRAEASFIRTEADELTYNLHIIIRFEIELMLFEGGLDVRELPAVWNQKYHDYLGITPPDDSVGVLQDVHWSAGLYGYFPTYSLGNAYAAQFAAALRKAHPDADARLAAGETSFIREWQRAQIHRWGSIYQGDDLALRVTGERLNPAYLGTYLTEKYTHLYGLKK